MARHSERIEQLGGTVADTFSVKSTQLVVTAGKPSTKVTAAGAAGIQVLTVDELAKALA
jgi:NAD-dependent DNA ligase